MGIEIERGPRVDQVGLDDGPPVEEAEQSGSSVHGGPTQNRPGNIDVEGLHLPPTSLGAPQQRASEPFAKFVERWLETTLNPTTHPEPRLPRDKLVKMKAGPFPLFRGTLPLFEQRVSELVPELSSPSFGPKLQAFQESLVPINGDAHPFNFGVTAGGVFGLNDFDEAAVSPRTLRSFAYELLRNSTGFLLLIEVLDPKKETALKKDVVEAMLDGYTDALIKFAKEPHRARTPVTEDNAPKGIVRDLLKRANKESAEQWLAKRLDSATGQFLASHLNEDRIREPELQGSFEQALSSQWLEQTPLGSVRVNDAIRKYNSGTGTADLPRYRLAVTLTDKRGESRHALLELKQSRPGPHNPDQTPRDSARRVAEAQAAQLPGGDPLFGHIHLGDASYTVRELNHQKVEAEEKDLEDRDALRELAWSTGWALAQGHVGYNPNAQRNATPSEIAASAKRLLKVIDDDVVAKDLDRWLLKRGGDLEKDYRKVIWPIFKEYAESAIVSS